MNVMYLVMDNFNFMHIGSSYRHVDTYIQQPGTRSSYSTKESLEMIMVPKISLQIATKYIFTFISTIIFVIQASKCIQLFLAEDTVSSSRMYSTAFAEFPTLSICPDYFDAYNENILKEYNVSSKDIREFKFPNTTWNTLEFFQLATRDLEEILDELILKFYVEAVDPESGQDSMNFSNPDKDFWVQHNWNTLGRCYSFNLPEKYRKFKVRYVTLTSQFNLLIYLHHPGQFWWIDTDTKLPLHVNKTSFIDIRHNVLYALPTKISHNTDMFPECTEEMSLNYDSCFYEQIQKPYLKNFGCLHPLFLEGMKNESKICNFGQMSSQERELGYQLYNSANGRLRNCPSPCATMTFSFGIPDTQPRVKDKYQYKVYFKRYIGVTKESLKYPVESLIAEVGGYLGLLLGVSVLDCLVLPKKFHHLWNSLF